MNSDLEALGGTGHVLPGGERPREAQVIVCISLQQVKETGEIARLLFPQGEGVLMTKADQGHGLTGEVVRSFLLNICK